MKLLFSLLLLSLYGNKPSNKEISYRPLTWLDFRAPVPRNEPGWTAARINTGIELTTIQNGESFTFTVRDYMVPDSSFVRVKTEEGLRHEQTHFKINRIIALRLVLDLLPLQGGDSTVEDKADRMYSKSCQEKEAMNIRFDAETNHSVNREEEQLWESRISEQLAQLEKAIQLKTR